MRFDIDGVCTDSTDFQVQCSCAFGLSRSIERSEENPEETQEPPYFDEGVTNSLSPGGIRDIAEKQFYDYAIRFTDLNDGTGNKYLQVICSGWDETEGKMLTQEVKYFGWTAPYPSLDPAFASSYNMTTNSLKINQFLIRVDGENVEFYYHTGAKSTSANPLDDSGWTIFCGNSMGISGGTQYYDKGYITNIPNPINQCKWMMYPSIYISEEKIDRSGGGGDNDEVGTLQMTAYSGREAQGDQPAFKFFDPDTDWWARMWIDDTISECEDVDSRSKFNDMVRTTDTFYNPPFSTTLKAVTGYVFAWILLEDDQYYIPTKNANMDKFLGFEGVKILQPDDVGSTYDSNYGWRYDSVSIPPLISDASLFIRLDNFTQKTLNGAVSRPSKILFHLPRFDNSARSNGDGLYYEPHERVYVKLHNPNPITINEFDVSLCNVGEILAKDLQGQTIICFHFRENQTGFRQQEFLKKEKDEGVFFQ